MLAAFQRHNHTGVSKTVNLPRDASIDDVKKLIVTSRDMRLKGFTVYRDSSLEGVLTVNTKDEEKKKDAIPCKDKTSTETDKPSQIESPIHVLNNNHFVSYEDIDFDDVGDDRPGRIYKAKSSSLSAHITLTHDKNNYIREVFVSAGDVGADINAIFTAFGMILSVSLRKAPFLFDSLVKVLSKVKMDQRVIIRTNMSEEPIVGNSLPQAIGFLMRQRKDYLDKGCQVPVPHESGNYDFCPECQKLSLRREGSCRKCDNCGYSSC
jgi:ribonucleoside-diphosphate reductase alpha chain